MLANGLNVDVDADSDDVNSDADADVVEDAIEDTARVSSDDAGKIARMTSLVRRSQRPVVGMGLCGRRHTTWRESGGSKAYKVRPANKQRSCHPTLSSRY